MQYWATVGKPLLKSRSFNRCNGSTNSILMHMYLNAMSIKVLFGVMVIGQGCVSQQHCKPTNGAMINLSLQCFLEMQPSCPSTNNCFFFIIVSLY